MKMRQQGSGRKWRGLAVTRAVDLWYRIDVIGMLSSTSTLYIRGGVGPGVAGADGFFFFFFFSGGGLWDYRRPIFCG